MLLGILFNVCLIAANLLETKVIHGFWYYRNSRIAGLPDFLYYQRLHSRGLGLS